jgi:hypothetical protein
MPKRGLGAQVAVFAVIAVCVVAAIGVVLLTQSEATSTASSNEGTHSATSTAEATTCAPSPGKAGNATVTITQTAGQWPGCSCALVDSNSNGTLYVSTNAVVGDDVCIAASMSVSPIVSFKVVGPTGGVFLLTPGCVNSAGRAVSCAASWNTAQLSPGGSQVQPGVYELIAIGGLQSLRANFTLGRGVASGGPGTSSNTAVATVTVTETLTTQASQPTTTYAAPPNCGTLFVKITTTITTTVGAASTTTVTVTTTSTSYTQTVTSTSCTYSTPTVTSTVTTTVNP